jgi:hypothetical protein
MKKYILILLLFLTACSGTASPEVTPTSTPNPGEILMQLGSDKIAAESTQASVNMLFTATAQVIGITSTSQFLATQDAVTQQARIDAQATSDQGRRDAAACRREWGSWCCS